MGENIKYAILITVVVVGVKTTLAQAVPDKVVALPNLHINESQFGQPQETWPSVSVIDLTPGKDSICNQNIREGIITGNFNAGNITTGTEGAVLFSMSEDYAMIEDGEYKDKHPESDHGRTRSLFIVGVGKIPYAVLSVLAGYTPYSSANNEEFVELININNNTQGMYVIVAENKKVFHFFKDDSNDYKRFLDGQWHSFAVYSFPPASTRHDTAQDALRIIVDGNILAFNSQAFYTPGNDGVFLNFSKGPENRQVSHAITGACMLQGRYVTPVKSNLAIDNLAFFTEDLGMNDFAQLSNDPQSTTVEQVSDVSSRISPGQNLFNNTSLFQHLGTSTFILTFNETGNRWISPFGTDLKFGVLLNGAKVVASDIINNNNPPVYAVNCEDPEPSDHLGKTLHRLRCPQKYPNYVMVVAHRGYHRDYTEHSLPSVTNLADLLNNGVDMVELDVRFTRDLVPVLTHDLYLERLSNGTGSIQDVDWSYVQTLHLKDYQGNVTPEKFVSLSQAYDSLKDKTHILLDIKTSADLRKDRLVRCLQLAEQKGMLHQIVAGGGSWTLKQMQAEYPHYFGKFLFIPSIDAVDINRRDAQKFLAEYIQAGYAPMIGIRYKTYEDTALQPVNFVDYVNSYGVRAIIFARWPDFLEGNNRDGHDIIDIDPSSDLRGNYDFLVENGSSIITTDRPLLLVDYLKAIGRH